MLRITKTIPLLNQRPLRGYEWAGIVTVYGTGLLPLGGSRQPAEGLATVVGVLWLLLLPGGLGSARVLVAAGVALFAAGWGAGAEAWLRRRNQARAEPLFHAWGDAGTGSTGLARLRAAGLLH